MCFLNTYSYGPLPVIRTYNSIKMECIIPYNPIYNQLSLIHGHNCRDYRFKFKSLLFGVVHTGRFHPQLSCTWPCWWDVVMKFCKWLRWDLFLGNIWYWVNCNDRTVLPKPGMMFFFWGNHPLLCLNHSD